MSKLFNPKSPSGYDKYEQGGALKAMRFQCELDSATKGKERFVERSIDPRVKLLNIEDDCH